MKFIPIKECDMMKSRACLLCVLVLLLICSSCRERDQQISIQVIRVDPSELTLKEGESYLLTIRWSPNEVKGIPIFTSEDGAIATVDDEGKVTAHAEGETKINVSMEGRSAFCRVRVVREVPSSAITSVIINPKEMILGIAEKSRISVQWLPADVEATPLFASNDTSIVIVDDRGVVEAISPGSAEVKVTIQDVSAVCSVTVMQKLSQMPLLAFGKDKATQGEIARYEHERGRELSDGVIIQESFKAKAFVNKTLDLFPVVSYGMEDNNDNPIIVVLGKEEIVSCTQTLALLRDNGFSNVVVEKNDKGKMMIRASQNGNDNIVLLGQEQRIADSDIQPETRLILMIINKDGYPLPSKLHDCIMGAIDFPSWQEFMSGNVASLKAFEEALGFRYFNESESSVSNLLFTTRRDQRSRSNIDWVYYVRDPASWVPFIDCQINCIDQAKEIDTEAIRLWLSNNGFTRNFKRAFSKNDWYYVWNSDQSVGAQLYIDRQRGICAMQIFPGNVLMSAPKVRGVSLRYPLHQPQLL